MVIELPNKTWKCEAQVKEQECSRGKHIKKRERTVEMVMKIHAQKKKGKDGGIKGSQIKIANMKEEKGGTCDTDDSIIH